MRTWRFGKPKTPGFGISRDYYLTILSSRAVLPPMLEMLNPTGAGGAVVGFGAPLAEGASKDSLGRPLERGAYAIASKDQRTVLRLLAMSKEEAGFDPEPFLRSPLASQVSEELRLRVRATWLIGQLTFESHDPMVYPSIDFLLDFAARFAYLTEGVVADPISRRYLLPEEVRHPHPVDPLIDARDVVGLSHRIQDGIHLFSLGMQKFGMPEFEMKGVEAADLPQAEAFMMGLCQTNLMGSKSHLQDKVGAPGLEFEIREGGLDRGLWEGIDVWELTPPAIHTTGECLAAWQATLGRV